MTYEYKLNKTMTKKYGFTHLLCNGWFGVDDDKFNKKFNANTSNYINISLSLKDIDYITSKCKCKEY